MKIGIKTNINQISKHKELLLKKQQYTPIDFRSTVIEDEEFHYDDEKLERKSNFKSAYRIVWSDEAKDILGLVNDDTQK